jgi:large subunit ribosomal protein L17
MRHRKKFNHLGRKAGHRKALLANMASSLILHKRISTTTAKAKALRMYVEPLITKTKDLTTQAESSNAHRVVFGYLQNKYAVKELFGEVAPKVASRPGGYTRILKTGTRLGDNADMCIIELVDYNENLLSAKEDNKKSTRRSRRGGKKTTTAGADVATKKTVAPAESTTVEESPIKEETKVSEVTEEVKEDIAEETPDVKAEESSEEKSSEKGEDTEEKKD